MLKHSPIFWIATVASLITGIYGFTSGHGVVAVPYTFLNPLAFLLITSWKKFEPIKRRLEIWGALVIFLNIPGSVYLHKLGIQYDIILHFFAAFVVFQAVYLILPIFLNYPRIPRLTAAIVTIAGGVAFEGVQKMSDLLLGTQLFFDVAQPVQIDFALDILMDVLGTLVGVVYLKLASSPSGPASPDRA